MELKDIWFEGADRMMIRYNGGVFWTWYWNHHQSQKKHIISSLGAKLLTA